jgi:hypothetical protein
MHSQSSNCHNSRMLNEGGLVRALVTGCDSSRLMSFRRKEYSHTLQIRNYGCDSSSEETEKATVCHQTSRFSKTRKTAGNSPERQPVEVPT